MSWEGRELETIENLLIEIRDRLPGPRDASAGGGVRVDTGLAYDAEDLKTLGFIENTLILCLFLVSHRNLSMRNRLEQTIAAIRDIIQKQGKQ